MQAELELIAARFEGDRLRYLVGRQACATGIDPDDTAKAAMAVPQVLPRDAKAVGSGIASVVAHAVAHLAFLVRQEPNKYGHALSPETLAHLAQVEPDVAGRFYRERAA